MEHSALHGIQLTGMLLALAGPIFVLWILRPAERALGSGGDSELGSLFRGTAARWMCIGALVAAGGALIDLVVQTSEVQGRTVLGGIDLALTGQFVTKTAVGRFGLARAGLLLAAGLAARFLTRGRWWTVLFLSLGAVVLAGQVSHAAAQPVQRTSALSVQLMHLIAGAAWIGVLMHLLAARKLIEQATNPGGLRLITEIVRRFSPIALASTSLIAISGLVAARRFIIDPGALLSSAYGLTLLVKLGLLGGAIYAGWVNFRKVRPALLTLARSAGVTMARGQSRAGSLDHQAASVWFTRWAAARPCPAEAKGTRTEPGATAGGVGRQSPEARTGATMTSPQPFQSLTCCGEEHDLPQDGAPSECVRVIGRNEEPAASWLRRFGRMLELEVTAGVLVVIVAGIVGSVSPPGEGGSQRLTAEQARAVLAPDLPTTAIVNPASFYGDSQRGLNDLRYSEFTHNWSGVMVTFLGACWLLQAGGGIWGARAGRTWPWLLIPFAGFVAVASDPEVWLLHRVSLGQALADPQLLEHQLGAVLVLLLAWLGWRDGRNVAGRRPLGYALPVIIILGSLSLLGHAHSALTGTEELTNLINVHHAIFGAIGVFAGTVRWLELRDLFPARFARWAWPGLIMSLGIYMACFYREIV